MLVGTQMVAKGHDFPEVTLGVVLDADGSLRLPDFRAEERTFALITQLAGRSGRGEAGGGSWCRRWRPALCDPPRRRDTTRPAFLAEELERRRALRYPPFSHLIEIGLSSPEERPLDAAADALRALSAERLAGEAELLGPAPLFRRRGRHRRRLVVKSTDRTAAVAAVRDAVVDRGRGPRAAGGLDLGRRRPPVGGRCGTTLGSMAEETETTVGLADEDGPIEVEAPEGLDPEAAGAPCGGARPGAQVRRPGAALGGLAGHRVRRGTGRGG